VRGFFLRKWLGLTLLPFVGMNCRRGYAVLISLSALLQSVTDAIK